MTWGPVAKMPEMSPLLAFGSTIRAISRRAGSEGLTGAGRRQFVATGMILHAERDWMPSNGVPHRSAVPCSADRRLRGRAEGT